MEMFPNMAFENVRLAVNDCNGDVARAAEALIALFSEDM
jgi:hypothetical protein